MKYLIIFLIYLSVDTLFSIKFIKRIEITNPKNNQNIHPDPHLLHHPFHETLHLIQITYPIIPPFPP